MKELEKKVKEAEAKMQEVADILMEITEAGGFKNDERPSPASMPDIRIGRFALGIQKKTSFTNKDTHIYAITYFQHRSQEGLNLTFKDGDKVERLIDEKMPKKGE